MTVLERVALTLVGILVVILASFAFISLTTSQSAVDLLEGRTPLFAELQSYEKRDRCISELEAQLVAYVFDGLAAIESRDRAALADAIDDGRDARLALARLNTDQDPC